VNRGAILKTDRSIKGEHPKLLSEGIDIASILMAKGGQAVTGIPREADLRRALPTK